MDQKVKSIIEDLELSPHPEGGFYKRTYESEERIETPSGQRPAMTSIYYLLTKGDKSHLHRIRSNERWFHHLGGPLDIHSISDGELKTCTIGSDLSSCKPVCDIPPNTWFCAEISDNSGFSLVSCAVCPGFDFEDFELGEEKTLIKEYPNHSDIISRFCKQ